MKSLEWQIHIYGHKNPDFFEEIKQVPIFFFPWTDEARKKGLIQNAVYVVRPDGYIGFTSLTPDTDALNLYFKSLVT